VRAYLSVTEPDSRSLNGLKRHEELSVAGQDECPDVAAVVGHAERAAISVSQSTIVNPSCNTGLDVENSVVYAVNCHGSSKAR